MYFIIRRIEVSDTAEFVWASREEIRYIMDSA